MVFECFGLRRKKRAPSPDRVPIPASPRQTDVHAPQPVDTASAAAVVVTPPSASPPTTSTMDDSTRLESEQCESLPGDASLNPDAAVSSSEGEAAAAPRAIAGLQPTPLAMLFHKAPPAPSTVESATVDSEALSAESMMEQNTAAECQSSASNQDLNVDSPSSAMNQVENTVGPTIVQLDHASQTTKSDAQSNDEMQSSDGTSYSKTDVVPETDAFDTMQTDDEITAITSDDTDTAADSGQIQSNQPNVLYLTESDAQSDKAQIHENAHTPTADQSHGGESLPTHEAPAVSQDDMPASQPQISLAPRAGTRLTSAKAAASVRLVTGEAIAPLEATDGLAAAEPDIATPSSASLSAIEKMPAQNDGVGHQRTEDPPVAVSQPDNDEASDNTSFNASVTKPVLPEVCTSPKKTPNTAHTTAASPSTVRGKLAAFQQLIDSAGPAPPAAAPRSRKWSVAEDEEYERNLGRRVSLSSEEAFADVETENSAPAESLPASQPSVPPVAPRPAHISHGTEDEFATAEEEDSASVRSAEVFSDAADEDASTAPAAEEPGPSPLRHGLRPIFAAGAEHSDELRRALARRAGAPSD